MDLNNLRRSMKKTTFKELEFTEHQRQTVQQKIEQLASIENLRLAVLPLLKQQKTGYELTHLLHSKLEKNEGMLYVLLHLLEQEGLIRAHWSNGGEKLYVLSNQGKKSLAQSSSKMYTWKSLLQG
ncbi:helix-turn-helix transcriptional regulator [Lysinibacillus sphaericus]|uniref:helix-turn-helix transcriptional regulator n=1 Tax=Lysinibacillus sphaericus TaxID=1421 RepID=UPI003F7A24C0